MAKVKNPKFEHMNGEVKECVNCPCNETGSTQLCGKWWHRKGGVDYTCPTCETYEEACKFADEHNAASNSSAQDDSL